MSDKKYGLILPEKSKTTNPIFKATRNVFGDDTDSDEDSNKKPVLLRPSDNVKRQAKIAQEKAIVEDPTVYQYDEIYDTMKTEKEEKSSKNKEIKKPRYIENLLKTATKRKIENERRIERQIQKEREKEGDEFADKEVFVTTAYKKKLEEMKLEEEKEKREEYLESVGDVTKQKDLGGFYRHLYEQTMGKDKKEESHIEEAENSVNPVDDSQPSTKAKVVVSKRNYRKRRLSTNVNQLSEGEIQDTDDEINHISMASIKAAKMLKQSENIDADSDFSIDESSEDESNNKKESKKEQKTPEKNNENKYSDCNVAVSQSNETITSKTEVKEPKIKIDIWKKRTVGQVFEDALKRFYERKATRS